MKSVLLFFVVLVFLFPLSTFGGGVILNEDDKKYEFEVPSNYSAFITNKEGVQGMVVSFETENVDDDLLWIFPVPASPEEIEIGISPGDVRFSGTRVIHKAKEEIEDKEKWLRYSQIWPYFYEKLFDKVPEEVYIKPISLKEASVEVQELVKIHKHLKEEGMEVQLITAKEKEALLEYLKERGIEVEPESISSLEKYLSEDFSFIVSFMEAPEKEEVGGEKEILKSIRRGVMAKFPTEEIYYPLSSMQIHGDERASVTLNVAGFVSPEIFERIKEDTNTEYFLSERITMEDGHKTFLENPEEIEKFTKTRISTASKNLTQDLKVSEETPFLIFLSYNFYKCPWVFFFFALAIFSFVAGMITGPIVSGKDRNIRGILRWGKIGLFNVLSIIGLSVRVGFEKMENGKVQKPLIVILYTIVFVLLTFFTIGKFFE